MKKILLSSICAVALVGSAFAQGTVTWTSFAGNFIGATNSTTFSSLVGSTPGGAVGSGATGSTATTSGQFYYALLYNTFSGSQAAAPTTLGQLASWTATGLTATNSAIAGRIIAVNGSTGATVPWASGITNSIMVVGWSINLGTDYATVLAKLQDWGNNYVANAFFGVSATGYINPNVGNPGPTIIGASPNVNGLPINSGASSPAQLFLLSSPTVVPEPATMVLAGLGGLSLLAFRRKK